jgi:predicted nucleic acid-binding protein
VRRFVIDASVAAKWFFDEEHSIAAYRLAAADVAFAAPELILLEMANIFWKKARRQEIASDVARNLYASFTAVPIDYYPVRPLATPAIELAMMIDRTPYDSSYLMLATQLDCPLVTADRKFYDAVVPTPLTRFIRWVGDEV